MFDAFKIGVTIGLTNLVSDGLRIMAKDFARTEEQAKTLEAQIGRIQGKALKGSMLLGAGAGMLSLVTGPLEEVTKWDQAVAKCKLFGMGDAMNAEAASFARSMNVMGTSYTDAMQAMNTAQGIFMESGLSGPAALASAKMAAPMLAKTRYVSASLDDDTREKLDAQVQDMTRFISQRGGAQDGATFNRMADAGWKAIQSRGGNLNFHQLGEFMDGGGAAALGLSDQSLYAGLQPIIGQMSGKTAGADWSAAYQRLVSGEGMSREGAQLLTQAQVWDKSKLTLNGAGGVAGVTGNPMRDLKAFSADPVAFYERNILPQYAKMHGGKGLSDQERQRDNTVIFGKEGGALFSTIDAQLAKIHQSTSAWQQAYGVDKSVAVAGGTLKGKEIDLQAKWADVTNTLGQVILPYAIWVVEKLTNGLAALSGWTERNQGLIKVLTVAFIGLGSAITVRGGAMLLSFALRSVGLAMRFGGAGGPGGLVTLASKLTGVGERLGSLSGVVAGLGTLGATLGTLAGGLLALGAVTSAMAWGLNKLDPDADEYNHPGMRRKRLRGRPDIWEKDASLPQEHAGMHFQRAGRSGSWVPDAAAIAPVSVTAPDPHASEHFVGRGATGHWEKDFVAPPAAIARSPSVGAPVSASAESAPIGRHEDQEAFAQAVANSIKQSLSGVKMVVDGQVLGKLTMAMLNHESMRPSTGTSAFDSHLSPMRPDFSYP